MFPIKYQIYLLYKLKYCTTIRQTFQDFFNFIFQASNCTLKYTIPIGKYTLHMTIFKLYFT